MIKILLLLSIFSYANFFQVNSCSKFGFAEEKEDPIIEQNLDKNIAGKSVKISELNEQKPSEGVFETKGFVAKISVCPACPPNAQCKPCMKDNIIISEENKILETYDLTEKEMIIFTNKARSFEVGEEYIFKFKITDKKTTSSKLNDVELISADLVFD